MSKGKFLVVEMLEREKTITKLKSSLYSLSIDSLVKQAIDNYEGEIENMNCSYCQEKTIVSKKKSKEFQFEMAGNNYEIDIHNYPINTCCTCGAEFDDMNTAVYTDELIKYEILECMKTRNPLPNELDFNDLLKM